jgi:NAD(P)-dependent dehydrogenase (short-subunit alcohol dehydrogenase family)
MPRRPPAWCGRPAGGPSPRRHLERSPLPLPHQPGWLDSLINNAAYQMSREGIAQIPDGEWEHTFRTNVYSPQ